MFKTGKFGESQALFFNTVRKACKVLRRYFMDLDQCRVCVLAALKPHTGHVFFIHISLVVTFILIILSRRSGYTPQY